MSTDPTLLDPARGPWGDPARHLPFAALEQGLAALSPPRDAGELALIVSRAGGGRRETPREVELTPEGGVPGDAWLRSSPEKLEAQIAVMRVDVARLMANGQDLTLPGDNLLVHLDLSTANLPVGSRLCIGGSGEPGGAGGARSAVLEVTPEPHHGCRKFRQRFGGDALRLTADRRLRPLRLRGIYLRVVEGGRVAVGDRIDVRRRGAA